MDPYLAGSIVGRFLASAVLIYVVLLLLNRFDFKASAQKLKHPLSIGAVLLLFLLGLSTGAHADNRANRPYSVTELPKAGISVHIPERPQWSYRLEPRAGTHAVILYTPPNFYPMVAVELVYNSRLYVPEDDMQGTALGAFNTARESVGLPGTTIDALRPVTYGQIPGYKDRYKLSSRGEVYSVETVMGAFPSGRPITMMITSLDGQLEHIEPMIKVIWENLAEISSLSITP